MIEFDDKKIKIMMSKVSIATQTEDPRIPILPLAKGFYDHVSVTHEYWETWRYHSGTQTEALREPLYDILETSMMKKILREFNEAPEPEPKRTKILNSKYSLIEIPIEKAPSVNINIDKIPEPYINPSLGKVSDPFKRRMRMISIMDHYEEKGNIAGLHIKILQKRYSQEFNDRKKYSLSGIRDLLRSRGFGVNKKDCLIAIKK